MLLRSPRSLRSFCATVSHSLKRAERSPITSPIPRNVCAEPRLYHSRSTERESRLIAGRLFSGFGDAGREHTKVLSESDLCHVTSQVPMLMPDQALFVLVAVAVRFSPLFFFFKLCRDARLIMSPSPFICPAVLYTAI